MQPPRTPIEAAIHSYECQLQLPVEERSSICEIATAFGVITAPLLVAFPVILHLLVKPIFTSPTTTEEACILDYIRRLSLSGHPPTPQSVYEVANVLRDNRLQSNSLHTLTPLSHTWLEKFRRRHREAIGSVWTRRIDTSRVQAESIEQLSPWFAEFGAALTKHAYKPENVYNLDETGYHIGMTMASRVIVDLGAKGKVQKAKKSTPGRQEWVTTIECFSAAGIALPPMIIFKGQAAINSKMVPERLAGWFWTTSNSGWTNDTLCYEWLTQVFDPSTRPSIPSQRRLLVVDGHGSHVKARNIAFCMQNNIDLMVLPAHSSHITQPLDIAVFGPLKGAMSRIVNAHLLHTPGRILKDI